MKPPYQFPRVLSALLATFAAAAPLSGQLVTIDIPTVYTPGYEETVLGEELIYHSPLPYVDRSLLVRSLDRDRFIEWRTASVPEGFDRDTAVFVFMAGIDVNEKPKLFDLFVNGDSALQFRNPKVAPDGSIAWNGEGGIRAEFRVTLIDKYGDAMGYFFLSVPREHWDKSRSLALKVAGESAGARRWFMIFKEPIVPRASFGNAPALVRADDGAQQTVRVDVVHLTNEGHLEIESSIGRIDTTLTFGFNRFQLAVPMFEEATPIALELAVDDYSVDTTVVVQPVRPIDLYLIHHTHLDIGYTHHQDEVERLQWEHLENALRYGEASEGYPDEARFIWNPEGLWAVESYFENHSGAENERLLEGIRRGWIHLDAMFANLLTGIASDEGLMRSMEASQRLSARTGVPITSAMVSDIPGFTWGLVPVLAMHGVKYLSIGPNFGHRIGNFLEVWGDKPFYWESPSGRERVLTWVSGAGYAWFHSGLGYTKLTKALEEEHIFKYLDQLSEGDYPYHIAHMRYNIGSDNGPPDPNLSDAVKAWNERYLSPRLIISNTAELFEIFEARYGDQLPVYGGDMTGYWEDGAASSARETALVRRTAESLAQTEALSAMLGVPLPDQDLYEAWRNVLLYYEHTWGSWNSVSEPEADFTIGQWQRKRSFADSAAAQANRLRSRVLEDRRDNSPGANLIEVINTLNWARTDVVLLPADQSQVGNSVVDDAGNAVPSQRLSTGELAFLAGDVPPFGARRYNIVPTAATPSKNLQVGVSTLSNGSVRFELDTLLGTIRSLKHRGREYVARDKGEGLNQYFYVAGRSPADTAKSKPAEFRVVEQGPLVAAIEVRSSAPGTNSGIRSEVRIYAGIDRVDITNWIDKSFVYAPEAVLYKFPFDIEEPEVRIDVPWGSFDLESGQLPGASRNYLSHQRWVDISDGKVGITIVSVDVPMVQFGEIGTDAIVAGWREQVPPSATLFFYPMNNYWETNYRAGQQGRHEMRHTLLPHRRFDASEAERFARSTSLPLIAFPVGEQVQELAPLFAVEAESLVVTALKLAADGEGLVVRLYNPRDESRSITFRWPVGEVRDVYRSDAWEAKLEALPDQFQIKPKQVLTVRVSL